MSEKDAISATIVVEAKKLTGLGESGERGDRCGLQASHAGDHREAVAGVEDKRERLDG